MSRSPLKRLTVVVVGAGLMSSCQAVTTELGVIPNGDLEARVVSVNWQGATGGFEYRVLVGGTAQWARLSSWVWKGYRSRPCSVQWEGPRVVEVVIEPPEPEYRSMIRTRHFGGVSARTREERGCSK